MNLPPGSFLFGVAPKILIDCASQLSEGESAFGLDDFCKALGAPLREAAPVLEQMIAAGFVDLGEPPSEQFVPTQKLRQLALSNVTAGVPREAAEQLLDRIIRMAATVNATPEIYPCPVVRVVVFGSYLSDKKVLGDLDIGVELGNTPPPRPDELRKGYREILAVDLPARKKTLAALRLRKPMLISVHLMDEVERLGTPYREIFGV